MKINMNQAYSFDDVLIVPQYGDIESRSFCDTGLQLPSMQPLHIPVFAANMDTICGVEMAYKMQELGGVGIVHRYMKASATHNLIHGWFHTSPWKDWELETAPRLTVAVGSVLNDKSRIDIVLKQISDGFPINICVDIAHGDSKHMKDTLSYIRNKAPQNKSAIIAGNVCTFAGASRLFDFGADIVKVGVGGGSVCTTRIKTGCGYPQLAAIAECSEAGPIIADGGIRYYGDAAKAIAAGANAVMIGGMLAGTDSTPNWEEERIGKTMEFRGMASKRARASCEGPVVNAEGISTQVVTKALGSTERVVNNLMEGLKSAMSYSGCRTLSEFRLKAKLVHVTGSTVNENKPHIKD
jgi:IMP dehydrogenase